MYVFSDIHGNLSLYNHIKDFLDGKQETAIFLGDAIDRGAYGYMIMEDMLANESIIYIKGNHEDMFVWSAYEFFDLAHELGYSTKEFAEHLNYNMTNIMYWGPAHTILHHCDNGGLPTLNAWLADGCPMKIVHEVDKLPLTVFDLETSCYMCHAGCETIKEFQEQKPDNILWNREHFYTKWEAGKLIHGHTPTRYLPPDILYPSNFKTGHSHRYAGDTKIDIDCGTAFTDMIDLYDMDNDTFVHFDVATLAGESKQ